MKYIRIQHGMPLNYFQLLYGADDIKPEEDCEASLHYTMSDIVGMFFHTGSLIMELQNCDHDVLIRLMVKVGESNKQYPSSEKEV